MELVNFMRSYPAWAQMIFVLCLVVQISLALFAPREKPVGEKRSESLQGSSRSSAPAALKSIPRSHAVNYPTFLAVEHLPPGERTFIPTSAQEIQTFVASAPPLSRKAIADEAYRGRWVNWVGRVVAIWKDDQCYVVTTLTADGPHVTLTFPLEHRGAIEALRQGDDIAFHGQILRADKYIELVHPVVTMQKSLGPTA